MNDIALPLRTATDGILGYLRQSPVFKDLIEGVADLVAKKIQPQQPLSYPGWFPPFTNHPSIPAMHAAPSTTFQAPAINYEPATEEEINSIVLKNLIPNSMLEGNTDNGQLRQEKILGFLKFKHEGESCNRSKQEALFSLLSSGANFATTFNNQGLIKTILSTILETNLSPSASYAEISQAINMDALNLAKEHFKNILSFIVTEVSKENSEIYEKIKSPENLYKLFRILRTISLEVFKQQNPE